MAQRLHRRKMRAVPGGNGPGDQPREYGDAQRLKQMQRRNGCGDDAGGLREGREQAQETPSEADAEKASSQSRARRLLSG